MKNLVAKTNKMSSDIWSGIIWGLVSHVLCVTHSNQPGSPLSPRKGRIRSPWTKWTCFLSSVFDTRDQTFVFVVRHCICLVAGVSFSYAEYQLSAGQNWHARLCCKIFLKLKVAYNERVCCEQLVALSMFAVVCFPLFAATIWVEEMNIICRIRAPGGVSTSPCAHFSWGISY